MIGRKTRRSARDTHVKMRRKLGKHEHGTPNPIILEEERSILAAVDRALSSTTNSQVIGRNGEVPARDFLNRYLPYTLRASTGHFVTPNGHISPQIDIMLLDTRYPLLAQNVDGSVLAVEHAVITTIEVKTRLTSRDVKKGWENAIEIVELANEIPEYGSGDDIGFATIRTEGLAYRLASSLASIDKAYVRAGQPHLAGWDVYVLRLPESEQVPGKELGASLHFEPVVEDSSEEDVTPFVPTCGLSQTPLSDMYYRLVQDAYYCLAERDWSYGHRECRGAPTNLKTRKARPVPRVAHFEILTPRSALRGRPLRGSAGSG